MSKPGIQNQPSSYYQSMNIQYSAGEGQQKVEVDRELAAFVDSKLSGARDGRISQQDALDIAKAVADGGKYGKGESAIVKALWAARDDRKNVQINGQRVRLTNPAEASFTHKMLSFWGSLGAKASSQTEAQQASQDANKAQQSLPRTTQQAVQQFAAQQAQA